MLNMRRPYSVGWYALFAFSVLLAAVYASQASASRLSTLPATAGSTNVSSSGNVQSSGPTLPAPNATNEQDSPEDAYLNFVPQPGAPSNGGSAVVGQRFVLELWIHGGSHPDLTAQQTYISYTSQIVKNARQDQITTTCTLTNTVTPDNS